ncbi:MULTISPECIES: TRAP transporter small permease [unclassified Polaromonas]|uniref:TRAP transporter small permease n=1 Tax=unclassified Polaromonas TaxID=2638319 RepID=UPI0018CA9D8E|nr:MULTISPECIES: TRAP transporter small permease [unclassified Polaromonas]MBG6072430.1 TRAP-type C4-dicarboxylate transport system permease small subunit [Polaromonas sp. CG_9.7]MBG6114434.1 TRAP-type C4-dicarboxylate transport system permease small subunit [Polaromonas sp. CG_9.2]MDH6185385.1 TRAP-type C4-dicarboxylate transport system permease small subunit [Polaromonas sp. CG_23.6]
MTLLRNSLAWLNDIETLLCEWLLALFVVLLFAQIVSRQVFNHSLAWSEELSTYMFVWFAYLGAVVAAKMSAHNRVTVHFQFMPKWLATTLLTVGDLLWVAFNMYFVWLSYDFVFNRMNLFWKSQTLGVPMKYIYMILPIAFTLMSIRVLWTIYLRVVKGEELLDPETAGIKKMQKNNDARATS